MNRRMIVTIALLAFVAAAFGYIILQEAGSEGGGETGETRVWSGEAQPKVVAYYFHGDKRCRTCLSIEAYTKEAIESGFPEQLASGDLELRIVNVDKPENEHFIEDYQLTTKSVILADYRGGGQRWKNLDMIWEYVSDKEVFLDYIRGETEAFLGETTDE